MSLLRQRRLKESSLLTWVARWPIAEPDADSKVGILNRPCQALGRSDDLTVVLSKTEIQEW